MYLRQYFRKAAHSLLRPAGRRSRHRAPAPSYRPRLEALETRELLSTFTVVLASDNGGPSGQRVSATTGDLRYCVQQADAAHTATTDAIGFSSLFSVPQTITLNSANGHLVLSDTHPLTINAPTAHTVTLSGGNLMGVFDITSGTVIMKYLTIRYASVAGGIDNGSGINNQGTLTLTNCTISYCVGTLGGAIENQGGATLTVSNGSFDHDSGSDGGAIFNGGTAKLVNSILYHDSALGTGAFFNLGGTATLTGCTLSNDSGGGMVNMDSATSVATATLTNCKLSNDTAYGSSSGSGLWNNGTATLSGCTFSNDSAYEGGAVFVDTGGTVTLSNCSLSGDSAFSTTSDQGGGAIHNRGTVTVTSCTLSYDSAYEGGGIFNEAAGTVNLTSCTLSGNSASNISGSGNGGGAIQNDGTVTLNLCTLNNNSAFDGGAISDPGTATLTNCTLSNNFASDGGGGINSHGTITVTASTFNNNSTSFNGGAIVIVNVAALTNCTLANNSAGQFGGGVFFQGGTGTLTNCTLSDNSAASKGGGIWNAASTLNLINTIVAGNTAGTSGPDISGAVSTADHNLVGDATGSSGISNGVNGNIVGGNGNPVLDARLGPLQNNGGPTETMALLADSPAIGHADNAAAPAKDQRGVTRADELGETTDIGAFELL